MNWGNQRDILVFVEQKSGQPVNAGLEGLTSAHALAEVSGGRVLALLAGADNSAGIKRAASCGADVILSVQCFLSEWLRRCVLLCAGTDGRKIPSRRCDCCQYASWTGTDR